MARSGRIRTGSRRASSTCACLVWSTAARSIELPLYPVRVRSRRRERGGLLDQRQGSRVRLATDPVAPYQVYVRYLDAATALQLTDLPTSASPIGWSPDSKRVLFVTTDESRGLWSIAVVGGEPQLLFSLPKSARNVTSTSSRFRQTTSSPRFCRRRTTHRLASRSWLCQAIRRRDTRRTVRGEDRL